jgi:hypothetical protein
MNPDRPVSSLLRTQIEHLHAAEQRLPLRYRTNIYVNAIKTQGEAAQYSREVTEAIQDAHGDAAAARARRAAGRERVIDKIAAGAGKRTARKRASGAKTKKGPGGRKK